MDKTDVLVYTLTMYKILSVGRHHTTFSVDSHRHEFWELVFATSGSGRFVSRSGESMDYLENELVCIPPMVEHSNSSKDGFTNIFFLVDNCGLTGNNFLKILDNPSQILHEIFFQINYFFNTDFIYKSDVMTNLCEIVANYIRGFLDSAPLYSPIIERMRTDIIQNFSDPNFDLQRILSSGQNNPEYLRKLFKKETGKSPLQFLLEMRLNTAAKLLKKSHIINLNIAEIAYQCGFTDPFYFSRFFKKYTGFSPMVYRQNCIDAKNFD